MQPENPRVARSGKSILLGALAGLLGLAAVLTAGWLVVCETLPGTLPEHVEPVDPGRTFRTIVFLFLAAAAIAPGREGHEGDVYLRATLSAGAAAGAAAGVATALGYCMVHPLTDYPPAPELVPIGLGVGAIVGIVLAVVPVVLHAVAGRIGLRPAPVAAVRIATVLGAGGVLQIAELIDPTPRWRYPSDHPAVLAVGAALLVFLLLTPAIGLALSGAVRRMGRIVAGGVATAIVLGSALVAAPDLPPTGEAPEGLPRAVLLITVDTCRADHLGCYGYDRDTSPRIDAIAKESVLFERAFGPMPITDPSHTTILTGFHPRSVGVMSMGFPISRPGTSSLAEWFQRRGYRTGAITSRVALDPETLQIPGFDTYSAPSHLHNAPDADQALRRATTWLDRHGDEPFFLWVHVFDPHYPYLPPREAERTMFAGPVRKPFVRRGYWGGPKGDDPYPEGAMEYGVALYDGEIRYADDHVGLLVDDVRRRVGRENLLLVLTADHGETLTELDDEYGYGFNHGKLLARQELHVPLMISWPGRLPEGVRIPRPVGLVSLTPTITGFLGEEIVAEGRSLADALASPSAVSGEPDPVFVERAIYRKIKWPFHGVPEIGVVTDRWFYAQNEVRGRFLHAYVTDPRGERNLVETEPETARRLATLIRHFELGHPPAPLITDALSEDDIHALRGLGYVR